MNNVVKNTKGVNILVVLSILSGIFALILAFTPLRMFGYIPAIFGLFLSLLAGYLTKKLTYKPVLISLIVNSCAFILILVFQFLITPEVKADAEFEENIKSQADSVEIDLNEALKDLE